MVLQVAAAAVLGLMCGSELNIAAFAHPSLNHLPLEVHIPMRAALAKLLGRVMPFWMTGSTILNVLLLFRFAGLSGLPWRLAAIAAAIQVAAVVFSVIAPVPINNRIIQWTSESVPRDWRAQEHRWDVYHWGRTCALIVAFVLLLVGLR
jgi:hypothetical protein